MITGNIIFVSSSTIFIGKECKIASAIFYAPKIVIEKGFIGSLQAFASDSIFIGQDVELNYPSVVGLIKGESETGLSYLSIDEGAIVQGVVFGTSIKGGQEIQLTIKKDAEIEGQVYCSGSVDHKGKIYGSLLCQKLILKTPSSVYENHLLNAVVDNTKLSKHFVGVNLLSQSKARAIVRWMN